MFLWEAKRKALKLGITVDEYIYKNLRGDYTLTKKLWASRNMGVTFNQFLSLQLEFPNRVITQERLNDFKKVCIFIRCEHIFSSSNSFWSRYGLGQPIKIGDHVKVENAFGSIFENYIVREIKQTRECDISDSTIKHSVRSVTITSEEFEQQQKLKKQEREFEAQIRKQAEKCIVTVRFGNSPARLNYFCLFPEIKSGDFVEVRNEERGRTNLIKIAEVVDINYQVEGEFLFKQAARTGSIIRIVDIQEKKCVVAVNFWSGIKNYYYLCPFDEVKKGSHVEVNIGETIKVVKVVHVGYYIDSAAPYPFQKLKSIIKITNDPLTVEKKVSSKLSKRFYDYHMEEGALDLEYLFEEEDRSSEISIDWDSFDYEIED